MFYNYKEQEKELAEFDYHLRKETLDEEIEHVMQLLKNNMPEGIWIDPIVVQDIRFENIFLSKTGIAVFLKYELELTDPLLWKRLKKAYIAFVSSAIGAEDGNLMFFALLNSPITQKTYYGLFSPSVEFVTPVDDLMETFLKNMHKDENIYTEEKLLYFWTCLKEPENNESDENIRIEGSEEYIQVHNKWKPRSSVDAERYFWFAFFGGILGIHKFYARSYGEFFAYFLTLGYFGIGWAFDLLEICLGIAKDKKRKYIGPFENMILKKILCCCALAVYVAMWVFVFAK